MPSTADQVIHSNNPFLIPTSLLVAFCGAVMKHSDLKQAAHKSVLFAYGSRRMVHNGEEGMAAGNQVRTLREPVLNHMQKTEGIDNLGCQVAFI